MKKLLSILVLILILFFADNASTQDTFSIVAVDPLTGQVGSAGASCVSGSRILSDVHPGRGVIHTQASYNSSNQNYARSLMNMGLSPQQIRDSVVAHDASGNPAIRQYGIVDLIGGGRTAAYTGVNCLNYKNHILGPTYSIQGNILLGQRILDSMQARFLREPGTLADKLMAALQGAKVIGADTRCTGRNTSSISAFIRIGRTQDTSGTLYLDLNVNNTPVGKDPIDSLQVLYNNWLNSVNLTLNLKALIEGFYYPDIISYQVSDTVRVFLASSTSPYSIVDSASSVLDTNGIDTLNFPNANPGTYYIVVKHRNSIETWSKSGGEVFTPPDINNYNFTTAISQAFGNNLRLKGTNAGNNRYCIYSGDVDQNGEVEATDLSFIDNDALNFLTGYVNTDVNGDNFVDATDLSVSDNNAFNFVGKIIP